jgi:hypothetical protein
MQRASSALLSRRGLEASLGGDGAMRLREWKALNRSGVIGLQLARIAPATSTLGGLLLGVYLVSGQVSLLVLAIALFAVSAVTAASGVSLLARNGTFYGRGRPHWWWYRY